MDLASSSSICTSSPCVLSTLCSVSDGFYAPFSSLEIFAFFMLTGIFSTLLIDETNQRTLEDLSNEDQDGFISAPSEVQQPRASGARA